MASVKSLDDRLLSDFAVDPGLAIDELDAPGTDESSCLRIDLVLDRLYAMLQFIGSLVRIHA